MQRTFRFRNNRYWKEVGGSGHICDCCQNVSNGGTVEHRATGVRICLSRCYDHRREALDQVLRGRKEVA